MRVLRLLTRPNLGGPTRQAGALFAAHRQLGVRTLLVVGRCGPDETALSAAELAVPQLTVQDALARGGDAEGLVAVPELRRGLHPWRDWRAARTLRALVAAFRPHVLHSHTSKAGWLGRRVGGRLGVPVVAHTFHGHVLRDYYGPLRSRLLAEIERRLAARSHLLFAVSASCRDELVELGVAAPGRIEVMPPAIPLRPAGAGARERARQRLGVPAGRWLVACAGRLVPIKRIEDFVAMVAGESALHGHVHGDGPLRAALAVRCGPRCELRGATADLPDLLPAYDALLLPSRREGCPLVAFEAFAAGVPVVGYDVPGVRDALGMGAGLLVPERDGPAGLLRALRRLRADQGLRQECVAAGLPALAAVAPAAVAARLLAAYRRSAPASGGDDGSPSR